MPAPVAPARRRVATPARPAHLVADPVLDAPAEVGPQRAGALRLEPGMDPARRAPSTTAGVGGNRRQARHIDHGFCSFLISRTSDPHRRRVRFDVEAHFPRTGRMAFRRAATRRGARRRARRRPSLPGRVALVVGNSTYMPPTSGGCPTRGERRGRHGGRPRARRVRRDHGQGCRPTSR